MQAAVSGKYFFEKDHPHTLISVAWDYRCTVHIDIAMQRVRSRLVNGRRTVLRCRPTTT